jgi:hypothetical protein
MIKYVDVYADNEVETYIDHLELRVGEIYNDAEFIGQVVKIQPIPQSQTDSSHPYYHFVMIYDFTRFAINFNRFEDVKAYINMFNEEYAIA